MKYKIRLIALVCIAACVVASGCDSAPSPVTSYFVKYYGLEGFQTGVDMEIDGDGNFYMLGNSGTEDNPTAQLYLVKADPLGNIIWEKTFGPVRGSEARDLIITSTGNLLVLANTFITITPRNRDFLIVEFDKSGALLQDSVIISPYNNLDEIKIQDDDARSITEVDDGGFIIAGSSNKLAPNTGDTTDIDGVHVRLNSSFQQFSVNDWKPVFANGTLTTETKVIQLGTDNFKSFGYTTDALTNHLRFCAINIGGQAESNEVVYISPPLPDHDFYLGNVATRTTGGVAQFYLGGIVFSATPGTSTLFLSALAQSGTDLEWTNIPNEPDLELKVTRPVSNNPVPVSMTLSGSGGLLVLTTEAINGNNNLILSKLDFSGARLWSTPLVYGGAGQDFSGAVRELHDGKIVIAGTMSLNGENKMVLMKVNKDGHFAN